MDDYLSKPISRDKLVTLLARWVAGDAAVAPAEPRPVKKLELATIDRAYLDELHGSFGDTKFRELIDSYVETVGAGLAVMRDLAAAAAYDRLALEAHSLKGASANYGAWRMHNLFARLQNECKEENGTAIAEILRDAAPLWAETCALMRETRLVV
jgi:HPt (histidine-containing phosphotransfer) domain-containing protein